MKLINIFTLTSLSMFFVSCAHIKSDYKMLPTAQHLKTRNPASLVSMPLRVFEKDEKPLKPMVCFVNLAAFGNKNATYEALLNELKTQAQNQNAEILMVGDFKSEVVGSMSTYMGYGISVNDPLYRNILHGSGCVKSEVEMGIVYENDGSITYVKRGLLASKIGLREGMKLVAINSRPVANDPWTVAIEVLTKSIGEKVEIEYLDLKGLKKVANVTLE